MINYDKKAKKIIGDLPRYYTKTVKGHKIGFFGLAEPDWIETLSPDDIPEKVVITDFLEAAEEMCDILKQKENVDYIIALTHMRLPNDRILAQKCQKIDLILGGHDHSSVCERYKKVTVIKSGTDFEELGHIHLNMETKRI